jgi:hypothetical protein
MIKRVAKERLYSKERKRIGNHKRLTKWLKSMKKLKAYKEKSGSLGLKNCFTAVVWFAAG